jgi:hypothetical protein
MQGVASPRSIAASEHMRRLVEGYFELRALGPAELNGIAEPIKVFEVVTTGAPHGHFDVAAKRELTKFVGRERAARFDYGSESTYSRRRSPPMA